MENKLQRKYGLFTAICMVVGIVIGSGVFFKADGILELTGGDMPMGILAWVIGGAIMLTCLLTFCVMGQRYEKVNGLVDYAEATVGPKFGYYMGWFTTTIYYPAMTSVLAWVSAMYTMDFLICVNPDFPMQQLLNPATGEVAANIAYGPECLLIAVFYLCAIYAINALSPKLAGKFQTSTTVIKMIPLVLMMVVGVIYGLVSSNGTLAENFSNQAVTPAGSGALFAAICSTAFAYEGWIIATAINSEIKDSKKNLPRALLIGGIIIASTYILYYVGVTGGASSQQLIQKDVNATVAFTNIFGNAVGNILKLFIVISCLGTTNGLMLACTRSMYSLAARGYGPAPKTFGQVDQHTDMPHNSAVIALLIVCAWLVYFVGGLQLGWAGEYGFDSSELPIITIYAMYLPIMIQWMRKEKDQGILRRFVMPMLTICGSVFMIVACAIGHKMGCVYYLIVFALIMGLGALYQKKNRLR